MTVRKRQCAGAGRDAYHLEPSQMNTIPAKMNARSRALALRFFSLNSSAPQMKEDYTPEFFRLLPFRPTGAQERAVAQCVDDMKQNVPMSRLLQGDVGSGKTAVAAAVLYNAVKNGWQCAKQPDYIVLHMPQKISQRRNYIKTKTWQEI